VKKLALILFTVLIAQAVAASTAVISPNTPSNIVLDSSNNYTVEKQFDGAGSSPNDITYSWSLKEEGITKSGEKVNFTFDTSNPRQNTVELLVNDGENVDTAQVTQTLYDKPKISSATASKNSVATGETVDFSASASDTFGGNLQYSWKKSKGGQIGTGSSISHSFSSSGTFDIELEVTDSDGYSSTEMVDPIKVSGSSGGSDGDDQSGQPEDVSISAAVSDGKAKADVGSVDAGQQVEASVPEDAGSSVQKVSLTASQDSSSVSVEVQDLGTDSSGLEGVDEEPSGEVYRYQSIDVSGLDNPDIESASVEFSVDKSFLQDRDASVGDVSLQRYSEGWESYEAEQIGENEDSYSFSSDVSGFSYYAVSVETVEEAEDQEGDQQQNQEDQTEEDQSQEGEETNVNQSQTANQTDQEGQTENEAQKGFPLIPVLFILLLILAVAAGVIIYASDHDIIGE
jgi:PGF-pre-PGF domain-containing protein